MISRRFPIPPGKGEPPLRFHQATDQRCATMAVSQSPGAHRLCANSRCSSKRSRESDSVRVNRSGKNDRQMQFLPALDGLKPHLAQLHSRQNHWSQARKRRGQLNHLTRGHHNRLSQPSRLPERPAPPPGSLRADPPGLLAHSDYHNPRGLHARPRSRRANALVRLLVRRKYGTLGLGWSSHANRC